MRAARGALLITGVMLALAAAPVASAETFRVTKTADTNDGACDADCSLREAMVAANQTQLEDDEVELPAGTYALTRDGSDEDASATGDLDLTGTPGITLGVFIRGDGARTTTIAADGTDRVFDVHPNAGLWLRGATITGGGGVAQGAGIRTATLAGLTLIDAAVVGNSTSAAGNASRQGAGVYASGGSMERVLIARNTAVAKAGDPAPPQGAGIYFAIFGLQLDNVTLAENVADGRLGAGGGGQGAGMFAAASDVDPYPVVRATNVTIAANHALGPQATGPGVFTRSYAWGAMMSIIAGNDSNGSSAVDQCAGPGWMTEGIEPNLSTSPQACGMRNATDVAAEPLLSPLRDNGGPTDTMAPLPGSPAIDRGFHCPIDDQRGFSRTGSGAYCDIGAVDVQGGAPMPPAPPAPPSAPSAPSAPGGPAAPLGRLAPIPASKAFKLPSSKRCVSRRRFTIRVRKLPGITWLRAKVVVNGKRVKTLKRARITAPVNLRGLPKGRFTVKITATASDGRSVTGKRTYHTCARKRPSQGPPI